MLNIEECKKEEKKTLNKTPQILNSYMSMVLIEARCVHATERHGRINLTNDIFRVEQQLSLE